MSEPSDWALLARYLSGECSEEEQAQVEALIASDPEKGRLIASMRTVWDTSTPQSGPSNVSRLWDEIAAETGITTSAPSKVLQDQSRQGMAGRVIKWFQPQRYLIRCYAAVAALLFVSSLAYYWAQETLLSPATRQASELITLTVESGAHDQLILSDGTRIQLDAGSSLQYPAKFSGDNRTVLLNGEGYFEVASNPAKPFIIHANQAVVTVLGTTFNVRAWQPEQRVSVAVAEGKVSLGAEGKTQEAVEIVRGQMSTLPQNGLPTAPHPVDIAPYLGWMQHEAFFDNAPLHEILYQLERWYNVQFILEDTSIAAEQLTLHIQAQSLKDVLELISALTSLEYQRTNDSIRLTSKD
jgi:transmembrane sensor